MRRNAMLLGTLLLGARSALAQSVEVSPNPPSSRRPAAMPAPQAPATGPAVPASLTPAPVLPVLPLGGAVPSPVTNPNPPATGTPAPEVPLPEKLVSFDPLRAEVNWTRSGWQLAVGGVVLKDF